MQAMILAAGLGTRLLPHTLIRPKPLFPVLNQPLLMLTIRRLKNFGFDHIVVNCHHLAEQIAAAVDALPGVVVQQEEHILGTGGGLRRALPLFREEPLLVTNGDIYHTVDLGIFYRRHLQNNSKITLALHDCPRFNSVSVKDGRVEAFDSGNSPDKLAFTGLHLIDPCLLRGIAENSYSCIIDHYRALLAGGVKIEYYRVDGSYWTDMGTEEDYLDLHGGLLTGRIPCWPECGHIDKPFCLSEKAELSADLALSDWACIGAARIDKNCRLQGVVVWDDVEIRSGKFVDTLVSADSALYV
jgi:mannose-1-phosphate guanylyltransferase